MVHLSNEPSILYSKLCLEFCMTNSLKSMVIFVFMVILVSSISIQSVYADSGFTNVKKTAGIIMIKILVRQMGVIGKMIHGEGGVILI